MGQIQVQRAYPIRYHSRTDCHKPDLEVRADTAEAEDSAEECEDTQDPNCDDEKTYYFRGTTYGYADGRNYSNFRIYFYFNSTWSSYNICNCCRNYIRRRRGSLHSFFKATYLGVVSVTSDFSFAYEFEIGFEIMPLEFARISQDTVSHLFKRAAYYSVMGYHVDDRIHLDEQSNLLRQYPNCND